MKTASAPPLFTYGKIASNYGMRNPKTPMQRGMYIVPHSCFTFARSTTFLLPVTSYHTTLSEHTRTVSVLISVLCVAYISGQW